MIWKKQDYTKVERKIFDFVPEIPQEEDPDILEPIEYCTRFLDDDFLNNIVEESNKYAIQTNPDKPLDLTKNELEQFIGILYAMSLVKMPSTRLYWSKEFYFDKVAGVMRINRFEKIKQFLHCNDNLARPENCDDRLYKIRPVVDALKKKFTEICPTEKLCIDEQMVPFKGKSGIKQYNPQKPKKWGYKLYILSGVDGLIYNFEIHTGAIGNCPGQPDLKASGNIVLILLQNIPRMKWHKLYIDNWYTGVDLVKTLHEQGIACVGTVRANRLPNCKLSADAVMKKKGRGAMEMWTTVVDDVELRAVKWFDNRGVTLLSTYEAVQPTKQISRWDRKARKKVDIICPSIVTTYNQFMGGVDLLDALLSLYRIHIRSKKWYHKLVFHFLDVIVVQAWLLYRRDRLATGALPKSNMRLREFKMSIANSLLRSGKGNGILKRGRPSCGLEAEIQSKKKRGPAAVVPNKSIRLDGIEHWPEYMEDGKKGRCKYPNCTAITRVICQKCKLNLCFTVKSNCFKNFHTE